MQYGLHGFGYVADIVEYTSITALKIYGKTAEIKQGHLPTSYLNNTTSLPFQAKKNAGTIAGTSVKLIKIIQL